MPISSDGAFWVGMILKQLWSTQSVWSQETFGPDSVKGPCGPLKHLSREAIEASDNPTDLSEYADCMILLMDATRRAGFSIVDLLNAVETKQIVNEAREWPEIDPATMNDPVEHIRT